MSPDSRLSDHESETFAITTCVWHSSSSSLWPDSFLFQNLLWQRQTPSLAVSRKFLGTFEQQKTLKKERDYDLEIFLQNFQLLLLFPLLDQQKQHTVCVSQLLVKLFGSHCDCRCAVDGGKWYNKLAAVFLQKLKVKKEQKEKRWNCRRLPVTRPSVEQQVTRLTFVTHFGTTAGSCCNNCSLELMLHTPKTTTAAETTSSKLLEFD